MKSFLIYVLVAVLLIYLINHGPKQQDHGSDHHRRLKLRSAFTFTKEKHDPVAFDPLIAEIERRREDRQWEQQYFQEHHKHLSLEDPAAPGHESQPEWEDFMDAEDYVNDEDRFNITSRLITLFPQIDVNPSDGFLSSDELTEWNYQLALKEVMHRTERDMEIQDKNRDGFVSFQEYDPPSWVRQSENDSLAFQLGWWREEHFNASDEDGDGRLNMTEFNNFLHPSDSNNKKLHMWLCKEEVRERDTNKDGKIDFQEFFHGLFDMIRNYDDPDHNASHVFETSREVPAKKLFGELDRDNDGYVSADELLPIVNKLHPGERFYAKQQADYTIMQADKNKDGRLDVHEMIENPYVFYNAVFADDEDDDYDYHDEFR
ncbi:uncharacterized protein LOC116268396 [Nymphaea colorata]|nr:uncharacterized protein LOC116268396 [Nymphaea colorata]